MSSERAKAKAEMLSEDTAMAQALRQLKSVREMVADLRAAEEDCDDDKCERARTRIYEDALSVEVRDGWHSPGEDGEPEEYRILLCTGGPAVQIVGRLGVHGDPETAEIEYQDWGTPWTPLKPSQYASGDEAVLLDYARTLLPC